MSRALRAAAFEMAGVTPAERAALTPADEGGAGRADPAGVVGIGKARGRARDADRHGQARSLR